jgi:hypothetical protein
MSTTCDITVNVAAEARTYPYVGAIKDGATCGNTFLFLQQRQEPGRAIAGKGWREYAEGQTQGVGQYEMTRYIPADGKVTLKTAAGQSYPRIGKIGDTVFFSTAANVWFALEKSWLSGKLALTRSAACDSVVHSAGYRDLPVGTSITFNCRVV